MVMNTHTLNILLLKITELQMTIWPFKSKPKSADEIRELAIQKTKRDTQKRLQKESEYKQWLNSESTSKLVHRWTHTIRKEIDEKLENGIMKGAVNGVYLYRSRGLVHPGIEQGLTKHYTDKGFKVQYIAIRNNYLRSNYDINYNLTLSLTALYYYRLYKKKGRGKIMKLPFLTLVASLISLASAYGVQRPMTSLKLEPDITDIKEVLGLAELSANAYHSSVNSSSWRNTTGDWQWVATHGWDNTEKQQKVLRYHIFFHTSKPVTAIAYKGTSPGDKWDADEDNCLFSCCCSTKKCADNTCNIDEFNEEFLPNSYHFLTSESIKEAKTLDPSRQIWFTGHSLGAVVASTAALKYCEPSVGFSAPGDKMFATRVKDLSLDCDHLVHHVGYYHDPIFTGTCGWLCRWAGYNIDSKCHLGKTCEFDDDVDEPEVVLRNVANDISAYGPHWIRYHTINWFIDNILSKRPSLPQCDVEISACSDCSATL